MKTVNPGNSILTTRARIVTAGLLARDLAEAAGIAPSTLSHYTAGRKANRDTRERIHAAFRALTGARISYGRFWANPTPQRRRAR